MSAALGSDANDRHRYPLGLSLLLINIIITREKNRLPEITMVLMIQNIHSTLPGFSFFLPDWQDGIVGGYYIYLIAYSWI